VQRRTASSDWQNTQYFSHPQPASGRSHWAQTIRADAWFRGHGWSLIPAEAGKERNGSHPKAGLQVIGLRSQEKQPRASITVVLFS